VNPVQVTCCGSIYDKISCPTSDMRPSFLHNPTRPAKHASELEADVEIFRHLAHFKSRRPHVSEHKWLRRAMKVARVTLHGIHTMHMRKSDVTTWR